MKENVLYSSILTFKQAGGAVFFIVGCLGWYMIIVIMAAEMLMSINLPVGDLSRYWRSNVDLGRDEKDD